MNPSSFIQKEQQCNFVFNQNGPYWHFATPGLSTEIIFTCPDDYRFGMTLFAECAVANHIRVYNYELMSNHLHGIVSATRQACTNFLGDYRKRMIRYAKACGRTLNLDAFVCDPIPIDNLDLMRNSIVYVSRNGFVVDSRYTPYSYPWGSGHLYFGPALNPLESLSYNKLSTIEKRALTHSRTICFPDSFMVKNGHIAPESFVDYRTGMMLFRDAHHYFSALTKNIESYSSFASQFGDLIVINDEEMYSAARMLSAKRFNVDKPVLLNNEDKISLAKSLHFDYRASNAQIRRILKLDDNVIQSLFPKAL